MRNIKAKYNSHYKEHCFNELTISFNQNIY